MNISTSIRISYLLFFFLGNMIDPGSTTYGINRAGYTLHSAIHKARPDIKCIIHLHTPAVAAVSAMKCGLLPLSQDALFCGINFIS